MQAIDALRANAEGWWAVSLSPLITQAREFNILHRLKTFPVMPYRIHQEFTICLVYRMLLLGHGFLEVCRQSRAASCFPCPLCLKPDLSPAAGKQHFAARAAEGVRGESEARGHPAHVATRSC